MSRVSLLIVLVIPVGLWLASVFIPCFNLLDSPVCHGNETKKVLALTFDDGPNEPYTSQILDTLARTHTRATFFLVGKHVAAYPQVVARIVREGHAIGNHTWDHRSLAFASRETIEREIDAWESAFAGIQPLSPSPKLFRAPHGWKPLQLGSILAHREYQLIGWTHGVWDSARPGTSVLLARLEAAVENGAIILLHDGDGDKDAADRSQTAAVLPAFVDYCRQLGFQFVTIPEML